MMIRHARARRGLVRAVIVVCLLVGVFAMHGLTGSHDAAMAFTHQMPPTAPTRPVVHQAPWQSAPHAVVHEMAAVNESAAAAPSGQSVATRSGTATRTAVEPGPAGHLHAMGDVCLAMLTALALAMVAALGMHSLRATHPVVLPGIALPSIDPGPSLPWLQPTLSKLCVLRT